MNEQKSIFDIQSGVDALCLYLAEVVQKGTTEARDSLIDLLHKLVTGEIKSTFYADFRGPGQPSKMFLIADTEADQMKLLRAFEEEMDKQVPAAAVRREPASAAVIQFPEQSTTEKPL